MILKALLCITLKKQKVSKDLLFYYWYITGMKSDKCEEFAGI